MTVPHADSSAGDFFGGAVAIHGDHVLIGATGSNLCGPDSGAAYIYRRDGATEDWALEAVLQPDDCRAEAFFGRSVAIGARFAAVAASQDFFGQETPNTVYLFERDDESGAWRQTDKLTGGPVYQEGSFATDLALDGTRLLVTASGDPEGRRADGAAHIFEFDPGQRQWIHTHRLEGSGTTQWGVLGASGALAGTVAAVTASTYLEGEPGSVFLFEVDSTGTWSESERVGDIEDFFISIDADAGRVLVGESKDRRDGSGAATLLQKNEEGTWTVKQTLRPERPYRAGAFGSNVALAGDYALVVGFDEQLGRNVNVDRVVFVFRYDAETDRWAQRHVIDVGEEAFGIDIDLHGPYAVIGKASEDAPGTAYIIRLPGSGSTGPP